MTTMDNEIGTEYVDTKEEISESKHVVVKKLLPKILLFIDELSGHPLFPYQRVFAARVVESILYRDGSTITALFSRQSGKTETVANTIATLMLLMPRFAKAYPQHFGDFKDGMMVGCFAPVEGQAATLFARISGVFETDAAQNIMADPEIDEQVIPRSRLVTLKKCRSFARMQTANPKAKIEGTSYHIIIVDEAQDVDEYVMNKCVAEGTLVWTEIGPVEVEKIVNEKKSILSYDKNWDIRDPRTGRPTIPKDKSTGNLVSTIPSEWHDNGPQEVWKVVTTSGRSIEVTKNHRWIVRERNRSPSIKETSELTTTMSVPLPLSGKFGSRGNIDEGYFIGQIIGDGCTTSGRALWCGHEDFALRKMQTIAESWGDLWSIYKKNDSGFIEGAFIGGNSIQVLRDNLLLRRKGVNKGLYLFDYSEEFWKGLISGLLDSDGSVDVGNPNRNGSVKISLISRKMIDQLQDGLQRIGVLSNVSSKQNSGYKNSKIIHTLSIKDVQSLRTLRDKITLYSGDKNQKLSLLVDNRVSARSRRAYNSNTRNFGNGEISWDKITKIESVGIKNTYCVTVEPSNTVVWNGIAGLNSIGPMGAFYRATTIETGTPTTHKGIFYRDIQLNKNNQTLPRSKQNHFEANWKDCSKYNPNYKLYVEEQRRKFGEDSDEFQLSYNLKWLLDRGMFVSETIVDELGDKSMEVQKVWNMSPVVVGIDPARKQDSTVVTVVWIGWDHPDEFGYYPHRILNWLEIRGDDWEEQYFRIAEFLANYDVLAVGVDAQGVGDAVAQRLERVLPKYLGKSVEVRSVGSNRPEQSKRWKHLMTLIQRGMVGWPAHPHTRRLRTYQRFAHQMKNLEKKYEGPHLLAAAPNEPDAHDDYADSLAIACMMTEEFVVPTVEVSNNPFFQRG